MIWKIISAFPDYHISNTGQVKSIQRTVYKKDYTGRIQYKTINERILKPAKQNGYLFVTLRKNGRHKPVKIHHIVADAFKGPKPKGLIVLHGDNNKENNNDWNLSYGTKSKNTQDYFKSIGKRAGHVPYKEVPLIIARINNGEEIVDLAKEYNVTRNDIAVLNKIISFSNH